MCGAEVPRLKKMVIEGSNLLVCPKCAKFGGVESQTKDSDELIASDTITQRLQLREKRLKTRDVFEEGQEELALDYPNKIRGARISIGMSQDELGKKINEKKSVVAKLETGDMVPDEKLIKKLERALGISLKEKISSVAPPAHDGKRRGMTLGDFIRIEKEK
jgi:putative transcription factor